MEFSYVEWNCKPTEAFPQITSILRPTIYIAIKYRGRRLRVFAMLDTGADYCLFPRWMGERLGINIAEGKKSEYKGAAGGKEIAYFHNIIIEIRGWDHNCYVGFIPGSPEDFPFALLGTRGFFDSYEANFNVQSRIIKLKKIGQS